MTKREITLTDDDIFNAFSGYRFGEEGQTVGGRRSLVVMALLKLQAGYSIGSSMRSVLWSLGLVTKYNKTPTIAAKRWLYYQIELYQKKTGIGRHEWEAMERLKTL